MKKLIVVILTFLYISTNTGAVLHLHYCMGKVTEWDLGYVNKSNSCIQCGMHKQDQKKNACCKDLEKFFRTNIDQKIFESAYCSAPEVSLALPTLVFETPKHNSPLLINAKPISRALLRFNGVAVYIKDCVFLI